MEVDVLIGGGVRYAVRMGKNLGLVAIAAVLLTGCASTGEPQAAETVTVTATPEAAPITAEAVPEETEGPGTFGNPEDDEFFVKSIEFVWRGERPTDEQFIGAAKLACEQINAGTPWNTVQVTSGAGAEDDAWNNQHVGQYAEQIYCPEHQ